MFLQCSYEKLIQPEGPKKKKKYISNMRSNMIAVPLTS